MPRWRSGDRIELLGFGAVLSVKRRSARTGRNPRMGAYVSVEKKNVPYFRTDNGNARAARRPPECSPPWQLHVQNEKAPARLSNRGLWPRAIELRLGGLTEATLNYRSAQRRDCGTGDEPRPSVPHLSRALCGALADCGTGPLRVTLATVGLPTFCVLA